MRRVCFPRKVRQDRIGEYRERHEAVWPEMRAALAETGWQNYSLFLRSSGTAPSALRVIDFTLPS